MSSTSIFYQNKQIATVIAGQQKRSIHRGNQVALAESQWGNDKTCDFLVTDLNGSVLTATGSDSNETHNYSAYGNSSTVPSTKSMLGYNGERAEKMPIYILGAGYRAFSTGLMRFLSPDNLSPFGKGGINPYAYCAGDPINYTDPTGHNRLIALLLGAKLRDKAYIKGLIIEGVLIQEKINKNTQTKTALGRKINRQESIIKSNQDKWLTIHEQLRDNSKLPRRERMHPDREVELSTIQQDLIDKNIAIRKKINNLKVQKEKISNAELNGELDFINDVIHASEHYFGPGFAPSVARAWKAENASKAFRATTS